MYKIKIDMGKVYGVRFKHCGGKPGKDGKPGKPPKSTECKLIDLRTGELLATGCSKVVSEFIVIVRKINKKAAAKKLGKKFIRFIKLDNSDEYIAILAKGDRFSKYIGRKESLKNALENYKQTCTSKPTKTFLSMIWDGVLNANSDDYDV
jgi:hypothetical protein